MSGDERFKKKLGATSLGLAVGLHHFALHHFSAADVRRVAVLNSTGGTEAEPLICADRR